MPQTPVFVSMTAISPRVDRLPEVLLTLLNQTRPPDKIILNISTDPFMLDNGIKFQELPLSVREMYGSGKVEIYKVANHGPYRKLIPTLARYKGHEFIVVTADDDVLYPREWLNVLLQTFETNKCVCAYRCRMLSFSPGGLKPYLNWPIMDCSAQNRDQPVKSNNLLPTGRSGILYHSHFFPDIRLVEALRHVAPGQDDLAFRWATMVRDIPVAVADYRQTGFSTFDFPGFHNNKQLFSLNRSSPGELTENDHAWNRISTYCQMNSISVARSKELFIYSDRVEKNADI